jgi:hypothetical protein
MEVFFMLEETALVIAVIALAVGAAAMIKGKSCCDTHDCNEGRDCPWRKK